MLVPFSNIPKKTPPPFKYFPESVQSVLEGSSKKTEY